MGMRRKTRNSKFWLKRVKVNNTQTAVSLLKSSHHMYCCRRCHKSWGTVVGWHHVGWVFVRMPHTEREFIRLASFNASVSGNDEVRMWHLCALACSCRSYRYAKSLGGRVIFIHVRIRRVVGRRPWTSGIYCAGATFFGPPFSTGFRNKKIKPYLSEDVIP